MNARGRNKEPSSGVIKRRGDCRLERVIWPLAEILAIPPLGISVYLFVYANAVLMYARLNDAVYE